MIKTISKIIPWSFIKRTTMAMKSTRFQQELLGRTTDPFTLRLLHGPYRERVEAATSKKNKYSYAFETIAIHPSETLTKIPSLHIIERLRKTVKPQTQTGKNVHKFKWVSLH